ncbi:hypothetical protein [Fusibacillus kribbianus]|uniref:X-X-X-Leu-X-X-Gly heptad repeats n=1 Tax=Fusibacillus kribbianus TaxID=3044208 RepID=A0AAP4B9A2_9FIRM|nr:hypothetical protein [Ruminococcus sp. YH-rum2234]MDI9241425.1 hypothetical protein [Ruminococcus sp. YH-rum2234]
MRKRYGISKKLLAAVLFVTLTFGMTGAAVYGAGVKKGEEAFSEKQSVQKETKEEHDTETGGFSGDETVYVISDADGTVKKTIVSRWMQSGNGEETCSQTETDKELPVEVKISYQLDGKPVSPKELAGKSGRVTMRFDYTNRQYETVVVDGKEKQICVPFVMLTGMILDNEKFTNVEVSNGRILNDGSHLAVAGFALPGLNESLELDREQVDFPDYVEISADVTDFELETTMTLAINDIFAELDLDQADTEEKLEASLEKLEDAMEQLMDGSSALYDGLAELLDKSGGMIDGIGELAVGAGSLSRGTEELLSGTESLKNGAGELESGLSRLASENDAIRGGAKQVFDSLLQAAEEQLIQAGVSVPKLTQDNYSEVLSGVLASLDENAVRAAAREKALEAVTAGVRERSAEVRTAVEVQVRSQILEGVLNAMGNPMSTEQYEAIAQGLTEVDEETRAAVAQIGQAVEAQMNSAEIQDKISGVTEAKLQELIDQKMQSEEVTAQINGAVEMAKNGAAGVKGLKSQLDSYRQFYEGLLVYTDGVAAAGEGAGQLYKGAGQLQTGAARLSEGADSLTRGIGQLEKGGAALTDGVSRLTDGAMQLSDGLKEFHEEGIQKLLDVFEGDLKGLVERFRAVSDAAKSYHSFLDNTEAESGKVRFLYKTEEISAE